MRDKEGSEDIRNGLQGRYEIAGKLIRRANQSVNLFRSEAVKKYKMAVQYEPGDKHC